jgi:hypothetical protein
MSTLPYVAPLCVTGLIAMSTLTGCTASPVSYRDDVAFMKQHTEIIELTDESGAMQVAIAPAYQARVMTSGVGDGMSFGWINRELMASGDVLEHINPFGGEDRFWMGPEGGQFSIFFKPGDPFEFDVWQTPAVIDTEAWDTVSVSSKGASFRKDTSLTNYAGSTLELRIDRHVRLLSPAQVESELGIMPGDRIDVVAYESDNRITNTGDAAWTKETGMLSIWILGMFNPSPATTIVIPFKADAGASMNDIVNDAYFGKVPADRLIVKPADGILYFKGDGQYRSKIGVRPKYALPVAGSFDAQNNVLTICTFTMPRNATNVQYVNSMWEWQDDPFAGDVSNSYNDGPVTPGGEPIGPFYELETSSPALSLAPGETGRHIHRTFHLQGPRPQLEAVAKQVLGVGLDEITKALAG